MADLERFFSMEAAGVKGLFKEAVVSLQDLVKQNERDRCMPAPASGLVLQFCLLISMACTLKGRAQTSRLP